VSASLSTFFYATSTLVGAIVPVPGGLGITEGLLQEQMVRIGGVDVGVATAAMILVRLATLWFAVLVGFVAYALLGALRSPPTASPRASEPTATR
jgi:glycosyltransferase 2 family protein